MPDKKDFKARDLVGRKVILKNAAHAQNGTVLPAGLVLDAVGFGSALHLSTGPCPACGVSVQLRNVPKRYFMPLDDAGPNAAYPAAAVWQPAGTDFVECSRCGQYAYVGSDPATCARGTGSGELHWNHCPKCGAGMALPEQLPGHAGRQAMAATNGAPKYETPDTDKNGDAEDA